MTEGNNYPAFPCTGNADEGFIDYPGLTKREYAAIAALKGLVGREHDPVYAALISVDGINSKSFGTPEYYARLTAKAALIYADVLLAEIDDNSSDMSREQLLEAQAYNQDLYQVKP